MAKSRQQKKLERKQRKSKMRFEQYAAAAARKGQKHNTVERNIKVNGYNSDTLHKNESRKRQEAEARQKTHSGHFGAKEKVKQGLITPCEALAGGHIPENSKTGKWLTNKKKAVGCK